MSNIYDIRVEESQGTNFKEGVIVFTTSDGESNITMATTNVYEGTSNLFYTDERVADSPAVDGLQQQINNLALDGVAPIENNYSTTSGMLADQINQTTNFFQYVEDDGNGSEAYYEKLDTSTSSLSDYRLLNEDEVIILNNNKG